MIFSKYHFASIQLLLITNFFEIIQSITIIITPIFSIFGFNIQVATESAGIRLWKFHRYSEAGIKWNCQSSTVINKVDSWNLIRKMKKFASVIFSIDKTGHHVIDLKLRKQWILIWLEIILENGIHCFIVHGLLTRSHEKKVRPHLFTVKNAYGSRRHSIQSF